MTTVNRPAYQYHAVKPTNIRSVYTASNPVDFTVAIPVGRKLVPGSLRHSASLQVFSALNTPVNQSTVIYLDPKVGFHSFFYEVITSFGGRQVEDIQNYGRLIKMMADTTIYPNSIGTEGNLALEGRTPNERIMQGYLQGHSATDHTLDMSVPLSTAANKFSAPPASDQIGTINQRLILATNRQALYGQSVTANCYYELYDLTLHFCTIPDDGTRQPIAYEYYQGIAQAIVTAQATLNTVAAGLCNAVHMSFISIATEDNLSLPYLSTEAPPGFINPGDTTLVTPNYGIERFQIAVNSDDTQLVSFVLDSREEILHNYYRSFNQDYKSWSPDLYNSGFQSGYGAGLPFGQYIDFMTQHLNYQIQTQISNANPYLCYMFYRCLGQLA